MKAGDILATIDTPSLDAQFEASKAKLAVAQARYKLAAITAKRWAALAGTQAVSQQDVDVKAADAAEQKAEVSAAEQTVAQFQAMVAFKKLVAPFDGVVTARRTNVGDYVNATGGDATLRSASAALFSVADIHQMRIFVSVPQDYADALKPGLTATLTLPQKPDKPITAQFLTTANAVNAATRTIVTELTVDNAKGELWPGTYVDVHFNFPSDPNILIIPEQALLFRAQGMQVAVAGRPGPGTPAGRRLGTQPQYRCTDRLWAEADRQGRRQSVTRPARRSAGQDRATGPGLSSRFKRQARRPAASAHYDRDSKQPPPPVTTRPRWHPESIETSERIPEVRARSRGRAERRPAYLTLAALIGLCSCDLAPDYVAPQYVLPADYKGSGPFTVAHPRDTLPRGPWWEGFGDPLLNQLEQQLAADNPDLAAMAEAYTQARDLAAEARSQLFPQVGVNGLLSDNKEFACTGSSAARTARRPRWKPAT